MCGRATRLRRKNRTQKNNPMPLASGYFSGSTADESSQLLLRQREAVHKAVLRINRADVPADNFVIINQKIGSDILLLSGVVEHFIAASADLLSSKTAQVKALLLLNLIVVFINISKGFGDHHLHHLTGLFVYFPAVALQKSHLRQPIGNAGVMLGGRLHRSRRFKRVQCQGNQQDRCEDCRCAQQLFEEGTRFE